MPTSKKRSGYFFWNMPVPVPVGIAAVIATTSGCSAASSVRPSPKTWVQVGGAAGLLARLAGDRIVGRAGRATSPGWTRRAEKPFPFCVMTWTTRGPVHAAHDCRCRRASDVVAVDRAEVAEAELLEEHPGGEELLDALLDVPGEVHHALAERLRRAAKVSALMRSRTRLVSGIGHDAAQVLLIAPTLGEIDIPLSLTMTMMSRSEWPALFMPLVGEAAGQRAVADDRHHLVLLALEVARGGHPERGRHGGAGVAGAEVVVLALAALQEAGDPVLLPERRERLVAARQQLQA